MSLSNLRRSIDEIDRQIVDLFACRFRITQEVGLVKSKERLDPVDNAREEAQLRHFREMAATKGLNPELIASIFRLVIDEVVRNHRSLR